MWHLSVWLAASVLYLASGIEVLEPSQRAPRLRFRWRTPVASNAASAAREAKKPKPSSGESHETSWLLARGSPPRRYGTTDVVIPRNLSDALAWTWQHPKGQYHRYVAGGPVIDEKQHLYLMTSDGLYKFDTNGTVLWHYPTPGLSNNMPALMGDYVYGNTQSGYAFALNKSTGGPVWVVRPSQSVGCDSGAPGAYKGVFVMGIEAVSLMGGNTRVVGLDGLTGKELWRFSPSKMVWNLAPLYPGDDTTVFMDATGGVYRVGLHNGSMLWHAPAPDSTKSFSDGGAVLGPNQIVYTCSNFMTGIGQEGDNHGRMGALRAFEISGGNMLWEQILPLPCNSYPAVGPLGHERQLSVVVTPGSFMIRKVSNGGVMAFDAKTGMPQWQYHAPTRYPPKGLPRLIPALMNEGDYQGLWTRVTNGLKSPICLPAHWTSPTITGDGAVVVGRSDGKIYEIRDTTATKQVGANREGYVRGVASLGVDFETSAGLDVTIFEPKNLSAALHGAAAFAPRMMAYGSCDSLYVFKF